MVEVFKTNVQKKAQSKLLQSILSEALPALKINFDLADCDKILRIEGDSIETAKVIMLVRELGFVCEVIE